VFAGKPLPGEGIQSANQLRNATLVTARNWNFLNPSSAWFMCWQAGFMRWLEDWQPEVLIVEANPRYLVTAKAIRWMHRNGKKVIGWGLGAPQFGGPFSRIRQAQRLNMLRSLDAIIAYSRQGAEQYRKLGIPTGRVYVASNAVEKAPINPLPVRPEAFEGRPTLLFVGRLQSRKRVDLLIQACSALPSHLRPRLVIVGDGPVIGELRQMADRVYPTTEFAGAKHGAELESNFAQADLFVLPGTGGLAIQQAMAHGLPVIVAQGDGTQDDLVREENGWQVPLNDLPALINLIQSALSDPARLRRMGEASSRIVTEEVNVEAMVEVFIRVLNDLSKEPPSLA
ncbi:MAG TPA: glycosyltransferase family 4 protein, partial [Anaerolineales bacterium]|nr:glycosyltransferase family 4 protein [Anaerolineales bacterium]